MIKRRKTIIVKAGSVKIGSSEPIVIQSMTKVHTTSINKCVKQINQLAQAGCKLVRLAVPTRKDTEAFAKIVDKVNIPLIADVHFSVSRAIEAIEAGAAKIRLNPGNIKNTKDIIKIIDAAKMHKTAMRIGVNEASIRDLKADDIPAGKRTALMVTELKKYIAIFEKQNFTQIVLSAKSTNPLRTIETNRKIAESFDYPIHLGLTHAGLPEDAEVPSAVTLGALLAEGIGDTIRISVAGNPVQEALIAKKILIPLELYQRQGPELIVCPTCGRTEINVVALAKKIKKALKDEHKPIRIAVMGCIVNGPGEAADADLALCAGKNKAVIYRHGKKVATAEKDNIINVLLEQLTKL